MRTHPVPVRTRCQSIGTKARYAIQDKKIEVIFSNRFRLSASPHPVRRGQYLDHKTQQAHIGVDPPQTLAEGFYAAVNRRAADGPRPDFGRRLPRGRGHAADLTQLAAAVRRPAARGGKAAEPDEREDARLWPKASPKA